MHYSTSLHAAGAVSRILLSPPTLMCAGIIAGKYRYIEDLKALVAGSTQQLLHSWPIYTSPINLSTVAPLLDAHPDRAYATYIYKGLTEGFRIGFHGHREQLRQHTGNRPSALANPQVINERLQTEVAANRLFGPLPKDLLQVVHISPLGLVPKAHQVNKWRMICDLSAPEGYSINDGIPTGLCSLQYATVSDAINMIKMLGRDTQLVKLDLKDAYRIVPIHPADYPLLGIRWRDCTYIDRALPFGLRSAPKIFSAVADFIAWALFSKGIHLQLHYLDDFLFLAPSGSQAGEATRQIALSTLRALGIPVATHKTEGPTTILTFLGILINTHTFELKLPDDKIQRTQQLLVDWSKKRACTRRELESLLGYLSHAAIVTPQGRTFLRSLFSLLSLTHAPHHHVRLNLGATASRYSLVENIPAQLEWEVFLFRNDGIS